MQFLALNVLFCFHDFKMVLFFMFPLQCISTTLQHLAIEKLASEALDGQILMPDDLKTMMVKVIAIYSILIVSKYIQ
jgi:hypothetical protein